MSYLVSLFQGSQVKISHKKGKVMTKIQETHSALLDVINEASVIIGSLNHFKKPKIGGEIKSWQLKGVKLVGLANEAKDKIEKLVNYGRV